MVNFVKRPDSHLVNVCRYEKVVVCQPILQSPQLYLGHNLNEQYFHQDDHDHDHGDHDDELVLTYRHHVLTQTQMQMSHEQKM